MNKTCKKCNETKDIELFKNNKKCIDGHGNVCKKCDRERVKAWEKANPEKVTAWAKANPEKRKLVCAKYRATEKGKASQAKYIALYNSIYFEENAQRKRLWMQANKGRINATTAAYRKQIKQATPPWADMQAILDVYMEAAYFGMEVDHIVPIRSKLVCGLHTWENLQLLTRLENTKKGNRVWPDMPTDEPKRETI